MQLIGVKMVRTIYQKERTCFITCLDLALIVNIKWEYYTSKLCRTMYTTCTCGQGYSGIEIFCFAMHMTAANEKTILKKL